MDWTSLIIIVLIGGYPRPSRRFVLVIIPAQPRRHGLNRLAVLPARPRPPYLGVIILARTEQLRGVEATFVAVILAENPRLGRAGEHEHGCAHEKNPFHDAPCFACRAPPGPAAVASGSGWLSNTNRTSRENGHGSVSSRRLCFPRRPQISARLLRISSISRRIVSTSAVIPSSSGTIARRRRSSSAAARSISSRRSSGVMSSQGFSGIKVPARLRLKAALRRRLKARPHLLRNSRPRVAQLLTHGTDPCQHRHDLFGRWPRPCRRVDAEWIKLQSGRGSFDGRGQCGELGLGLRIVEPSLLIRHHFVAHASHPHSPSSSSDGDMRGARSIVSPSCPSPCSRELGQDPPG